VWASAKIHTPKERKGVQRNLTSLWTPSAGGKTQEIRLVCKQPTKPQLGAVAYLGFLGCPWMRLERKKSKVTSGGQKKQCKWAAQKKAIQVSVRRKKAPNVPFASK